MGTSELYAAVEALPEVLDSLVVDLEYLGRESYMPLFVVLRAGVMLDQALRARIVLAIRQALTPRHVPNDIFQVEAVPRTLTGKKLEVPIKRLLLGESPNASSTVMPSPTRTASTGICALPTRAQARRPASARARSGLRRCVKPAAPRPAP